MYLFEPNSQILLEQVFYFLSLALVDELLKVFLVRTHVVAIWIGLYHESDLGLLLPDGLEHEGEELLLERQHFGVEYLLLDAADQLLGVEQELLLGVEELVHAGAKISII